jgi:glycosyltransferase involved in cell wall biosynthesis
MKILRITSLGYEGGGAENGILLANEVLRARGHTVKVLSSDDRPDLPHFNDFSFKAFSKTPGWLKPLYGCFYPHAYFALKKVLREYQPDVVQLHTMSQVSPSVLFLLRKYPTVLTIHGSEDFTRGLLVWAFPLDFFKNGVVDRANLTPVGWLHYLYHRFINGAVYRIGFRYIDTFLVLSTYMQTELAREGIFATYVPNATRLFAPAPIDTNNKIIVYSGRLEKIKGVQYLLQALSDLRDRHPTTHLMVAGTGNYRTELENMVTDLGLSEYVTFCGHITRDELYALYSRAQVLVVPSVWPEPFGKVGIEAMSVGRPVVASNVGGIAEWLSDGETGFLVPPEDSEALRERVDRLFTDPELLRRMSSEAVVQAQQFSIEEHVTRVLAIYDEVIARYADTKGR